MDQIEGMNGTRSRFTTAAVSQSVAGALAWEEGTQNVQNSRARPVVDFRIVLVIIFIDYSS